MKEQQICIVSFPGTDWEAIALEKHHNLSEHLTVQNSPVLFGCRTGICGTCAVSVEGDIPPPREEEKEILELVAEGNSQARLACQIDLIGDIKIRT